jgi:hypothetical protein
MDRFGRLLVSETFVVNQHERRAPAVGKRSERARHA